jgi:uncharacterized membrane protein (DUF485 family)
MINGQTPDKPQQASAYPAEKRRRERLVVVAIAGFLALNFPMLSVFNLEQLWFGIPVFYWYLFGIWLGFLIAVALIMERRTRPGDTPERGD